MWKALWPLSVHSSLKHFLGRASHNILPTRRNLRFKEVITLARCPICECGEETTIHAMMHYGHVQGLQMFGVMLLLLSRNGHHISQTFGNYGPGYQKISHHSRLP